MSGITKRFLDITAGDNINFSLFAGEICALLGENGAGKTTLMNILFGYYTCDEGQIFFKGKQSCPGYVKYAAKNPWWVTM